MSPHRLALFQIHACVLLWGFTAILGKLISLSALPLVFWRVLIVAACLLLLPSFRSSIRQLDSKLRWRCMGVGLIVTSHWLCFYGAIKWSNASIAATCMATTPVFLSLIEPLIARRPFNLRELILAIAAVPGVALVVDGIRGEMLSGFWLGTLSAFFAAIFTIFNKKLAHEVPAHALTGLEMGAGTLLLGALIPFWPVVGPAFTLPGNTDLFWLLLLSIACTLLPFALSLIAMRQISAFTAVLAVNLEPVYTVLLAAFLFEEGRELDTSFYIGMILILGAVGLHTWINRPPQPISQ